MALEAPMEKGTRLDQIRDLVAAGWALAPADARLLLAEIDRLRKAVRAPDVVHTGGGKA